MPFGSRVSGAIVKCWSAAKIVMAGGIFAAGFAPVRPWTIGVGPRAVAAICVRTVIVSGVVGAGLLTARGGCVRTTAFAAVTQPPDEFLSTLELAAVEEAIVIRIEPEEEWGGRRLALFRALLSFCARLVFFTTLTFVAALAAVARGVGPAGWLIFLGAQRPGRKRERHGGEQS